MPGGVLYERRFGSCSAEDVGWAKTLQAIGQTDGAVTQTARRVYQVRCCTQQARQNPIANTHQSFG